MTGTTTLAPTGALLCGAREIGAQLGLDERAVYYLAEQRRLPVFKLGGRKLYAHRGALAAFLAEQVQASRPDLNAPGAKIWPSRWVAWGWTQQPDLQSDCFRWNGAAWSEPG